MTNRFSLLLVASLSASVGWAASSVNSVSVEQNPSTGRVTVSYALRGDPAVITIDIQTNATDSATGWVSIGGANLSHLIGAVNRLNKNTGGTSFAYWLPERAWKDGVFAEHARAVVTAWPTNNPPPYMAVDLVNAKSVFFYASREEIPGGDSDDRYKTVMMLMRKIPAADVVWRMGTADSPRCKLLLTENYYMAVYEMTQQQFAYASSELADNFKKAVSDPLKPFGAYRYDMFRGGPGPSSSCRWPDKKHAVRADGVLAALRNRTGVQFDIPMEAQWEFACRAGTGDEWNGESSGDLGWYSNNWSEDATLSANGLHRVGLKKPNAWGLYDMHGNAWEVCLETVGNYSSQEWISWTPGDDPLENPTNPADYKKTTTDDLEGRYLIYCGGGYVNEYGGCGSSAYHTEREWNDVWCNRYDYLGYRLAAPAEILH